MRSRGSGHIINISSVGGKIHEPLGGWYHAAKFAVEGLSDSLRVEVKPFGISVVVIEPGAIKTEWGGIAGDSALEMSGSGAYAAQAKALSSRFQLLERRGLASDPSVIANVIGQAVTARRPKTRYAAGRGAKQILFTRRVLTDRGFDRLVTTLYRPSRSQR
jgi:NAD(P)-dependent dehydrogenase (short-subunit alcohol dehydrogenase family)